MIYNIIKFQSTPSVGRATQTDEVRIISVSFQSTPSVGRATKAVRNACKRSGISIHALRGEGDVDAILISVHFIVISIHALRGEGDEADKLTESIKNISIHALRGEGDDVGKKIQKVGTDISIHALRGEGDAECRKC